MLYKVFASSLTPHAFLTYKNCGSRVCSTKLYFANLIYTHLKLNVSDTNLNIRVWYGSPCFYRILNILYWNGVLENLIRENLKIRISNTNWNIFAQVFITLLRKFQLRLLDSCTYQWQQINKQIFFLCLPELEKWAVVSRVVVYIDCMLPLELSKSCFFVWCGLPSIFIREVIFNCDFSGK